MWTLWKGDRLLGEIHPRAATSDDDTEDHIRGTLVPAFSPAPLASMAQHLVEVADHRWTIQMPLPSTDAHTVAEAARGASGTSGALKRHPTGVPLGVAPEEQLRVVDAAGQQVPTRAITVVAHQLHPHSPDASMLPEAAVDATGRVWLVAFWRVEVAAT